MDTIWLLIARYKGLPVIPVETVCEDFFGSLTVEQFLRKTTTGEIPLPVVRMYSSQKAAKGVPLNDLATFLNARAEAARRELEKVTS